MIILKFIISVMGAHCVDSSPGARKPRYATASVRRPVHVPEQTFSAWDWPMPMKRLGDNGRHTLNCVIYRPTQNFPPTRSSFRRSQHKMDSWDIQRLPKKSIHILRKGKKTVYVYTFFGTPCIIPKLAHLNCVIYRPTQNLPPTRSSFRRSQSKMDSWDIQRVPKKVYAF